ncbi:tetranectin [Ambystoma mexicanum]|uniref:tetranectin n=1 Tax=Ambystoma mexicanum TaxID=8296 RepID=UPI0037E911D4
MLKGGLEVLLRQPLLIRATLKQEGLRLSLIARDTMEFRAARLVLCLFCLAQVSVQQESRRKDKQGNGKKDAVTLKMIEDMKKQIEDILHEMIILKEQQALQNICLKGIKVHNKCFLAFLQPKTYHQASDDCIAQGGTLSTPENGDENDSLYDYMRKVIGSEAEVWIGINDMASEGSWVDMSGSKVGYKNWETEITTQPDGGKQENCVALAGIATGKWFDKPCKGELPFMCQFMIV